MSDRLVSGGVLVGAPDETGTVSIVGIVPTAQQVPVSRPVIDYETWGRVHSTVSRAYPGHSIVGWYVSRPGTNAHPTTAEAEIHEQFFPEPGHLLLAIDPASRNGAAYVARDGGFYLVQSGPLEAVVTKDGTVGGPSRTARIVAGVLGAYAGVFLWVIAGGGAGPLA